MDDEVFTATLYMMASGQHGTIYIGVTTDLVGRMVQHRERNARCRPEASVLLDGRDKPGHDDLN